MSVWATSYVGAAPLSAANAREARGLLSGAMHRHGPTYPNLIDGDGAAQRPDESPGPAPRTLTDPPDHLLDVAEAATLLGLRSPRTLYKWAYAGRIPSVKIGRLVRFRRSDVERLIAKGERPAFALPGAFR